MTDSTSIVPSVDKVLHDAYVSNDFCQWNTEGGAILVRRKDLRAALEEAYDPSMPNWPAMITEEDLCAVFVTLIDA